MTIRLRASESSQDIWSKRWTNVIYCSLERSGLSWAGCCFHPLGGSLNVILERPPPLRLKSKLPSLYEAVRLTCNVIWSSVLLLLEHWALICNIQHLPASDVMVTQSQKCIQGRSIQALVRKTACTEPPDSSRLPQPMVYWDLPFPDWKCVSPPTSPFFSWHYFSTALS